MGLSELASFQIHSYHSSSTYFISELAQVYNLHERAFYIIYITLHFLLCDKSTGNESSWISKAGCSKFYMFQHQTLKLLIQTNAFDDSEKSTTKTLECQDKYFWQFCTYYKSVSDSRRMMRPCVSNWICETFLKSSMDLL